MKTHLTIFVAVSLIAVAGCDQQKSGPIEPEAVAAGDTTGKPAPVVDKGQALFATQGPSSSVPIGTPTTVELTVTPSTGFKINQRFEWSFEFHPNDQIELAEPSVKMDAVKLDDARATIPINVTAKSAGEHTLTATANFSVCNDDKCELYRDREVSFKMAATDG